MPWRRAPSAFPHAVAARRRAALPSPDCRDERRAMLFDELHEALVNLGPHFMRHHRFERRLGYLHREIHLAPVAFVDDRAWLTRKEARHLFDRLLRCRKADALERPAADVVEALERERQMRAAARLQH